METKSFFGQNGLTSTSANHYCNLAKEASKNAQNYLANVRFYSTGISVIGQEDGGIISEGCTDDDLPKIEEAIKRLGELNSLNAFFKEAIKEKERLSGEAQRWTDVEARKAHEAKLVELGKRKPVKPDYMDVEDVMRTWSVGEQEKYLSLETEAAWLGKYIHEDGAISNARADLMKKLSNPKSVKENGRDTIIYDYIPTASMLGVDEMYFRLQARHREVQAELNGMKKRIEDAIDENKLKVDEEFRSAYQQWQNEARELDREMCVVVEKENAERMRLSKEVAGLKIVVPNRLMDVFAYLQNMK